MVLAFMTDLKVDRTMPINSTKLTPILQGDTRHPAVLIACGSFSPITYFHVEMLESAKNHVHLVRPDMHVVGGFISPVGDAYAKEGLASAHDRITMAQLALESSSWIMLDTWEASQPTYQTTVAVLEHLRAELNEHYQRTDVRVLLVCGADLLSSFNTPGLWSAEDQAILTDEHHGILVIPRFGIHLTALINNNELLRKQQNAVFVVPSPLENTVSSSAVRSMISRGLNVSTFVNPQVIEYIHVRKLYVPEQVS